MKRLRAILGALATGSALLCAIQFGCNGAPSYRSAKIESSDLVASVVEYSHPRIHGIAVVAAATDGRHLTVRLNDAYGEADSNNVCVLDDRALLIVKRDVAPTAAAVRWLIPLDGGPVRCAGVGCGAGVIASGRSHSLFGADEVEGSIRCGSATRGDLTTLESIELFFKVPSG